MSCHGTDEKEWEIGEDELKILLMGNPNVGKSVVFSKLTGMEVVSANYTGTTVSFTQGNISHNGKNGVLIDVPGTYSLEATSPAEEVAVKFLKESNSDVVICVLDATNLERNLNFALQLKEYDIPIVFSLNLLDVAERQGIEIDIEKLEQELAAPVIPTVAIRNIGLSDIVEKCWEVAGENNSQEVFQEISEDDRWKKSAEIAKRVQKDVDEERAPSFLEKLGDKMMEPFPGIPIAILVLIASLGIVVGGGKAIRGAVLLPLVHGVIVPFFERIVSIFVTEGIVYNVLVGEYGALVKGIEWPFALILPYVFLFYIVLSFLEDSGYLPRLAVLVDGILRKIGIQGGSIVPLIMGYGCAIPAILGARAATSFKERLLIASVVSLAIPCAAQTGAFIALLGDRSILVLLLVYMISFIAIFTAGSLMNKFIPGKSDPMLLEIPNLLAPDRRSLLKKITIRTKEFMVEAEVPMIMGVGFAALVAETGMLDSISVFVAPLVEDWLGLPPEATIGLMLGVIRRELAVLPLIELDLTTLQLLVGSVVALFYIPCLAVLGVLIKEFGVKLAVGIGVATIFLAFLFGGIINHTVIFIGGLL